MIKISKREWYLAIAFGILGFVLSSRQSILYLNTLDPISGLVVYYALMTGALFVLSKAGLIVANIRITGSQQVLGTLLIIFAFFILVNFESAYTQYVTEGKLTGASRVFFESEDGATFYFWHDVMKVVDIEQSRVLTYIITPFILVIIGSTLATKKVIFGGY